MILCSVKNNYKHIIEGSDTGEDLQISDRYVVNFSDASLCIVLQPLRKKIGFSFGAMIRQLVFITVLCVKIAGVDCFQRKDLKYAGTKSSKGCKKSYVKSAA